jgi:hypothetical protein
MSTMGSMMGSRMNASGMGRTSIMDVDTSPRRFGTGESKGVSYALGTNQD